MAGATAGVSPIALAAAQNDKIAQNNDRAATLSYDSVPTPARNFFNVSLDDDGSVWTPSASEPNVDPRFVLRKCELPPRSEFEPVENFVAAAIREQHEQKPDDIVSLKNYRGILEALRSKSDVGLLTKIMLAMRTSRNTMHLLTVTSSKHARLIHQIIRFNPFETKNEGDEDKNATDVDYNLVDAHFCLVVTLVSANSVFLVPAATALWKLLISDVDNPSEERYVLGYAG